MPVTRKRQRMIFVVAGVAALTAATLLVLFALEDSIVFFRSPTQIVAEGFPEGRAFRVGGLVEDGSLERLEGNTVRFRVTDLAEAVTVTFTGILPALFREGQGIIAEGTLGPDGNFVATDILAKHDETYMPAEVVDALKAAGQWQGE